MGSAEFSEPRPVMLKEGPRLVVRPYASFRGVAQGSAIRRFPLRARMEMRVIRERLADLPQGAGGIVGVEAEPGAGKTHFVAHAADAAHRSGILTATAVTSQIEETTAYFALRTLLPDLVRRESDPPELSVDALRERILGLVRDSRLVARLALLEDVMPLELGDKGLRPRSRGRLA